MSISYSLTSTRGVLNIVIPRYIGGDVQMTTIEDGNDLLLNYDVTGTVFGAYDSNSLTSIANEKIISQFSGNKISTLDDGTTPLFEKIGGVEWKASNGNSMYFFPTSNSVEVKDLNGNRLYFGKGWFPPVVQGHAWIVGYTDPSNPFKNLRGQYVEYSGAPSHNGKLFVGTLYEPGAFDSVWEFCEYLFDGVEPDYSDDDPYKDGDPSGDGGGGGNHDRNSDDIGIPNLPILSATSAGFITLFNPSVSQLKSLASYMWSDLFDIDGWRKIFADPMDAILGLSIVPVVVPNAGSKTVYVGNCPTTVSMNVASSQYVELDCGSITLNEFWGAYLDYDPYTKIEIYLPYCGTHPLKADDVMGKTIKVVYHVDILSGALCCYVKCGKSVLYTFSGQCASSIPITGDNFTNVINGALSLAGSIGSMVASGGMSSPVAISSLASTASTVSTMKPSIQKSGGLSGTSGLLGIQKPYLIISRPRQCLPARQNTYTGYPSYTTKKLSSLSGYTVVRDVHLDNVSATDNEKNEILSLLKTGVII